MSYEVTKQLLISLIRYGLIFFSGYLIKQGIIDQELADAWLSEMSFMILGGLLLAGTIGWRYLNIRFNVLALIKAVQIAPPADTPAEVKVAVAEAKAQASADPKLTLSV